MNILRKKIVAMSVVAAVLLSFFAQFIAVTYAEVPAEFRVQVWTDKTQYDPGDKGKLRISILNGLDKPVDINEIYIEFPWLTYNAHTDEWEGNVTLPEDGDEALATIQSSGGDYYTEVPFEVPNDGRVGGLTDWGSLANVHVDTSEGEDDFHAYISVMSSTLNMAIAELGNWMTILTAAIVICTIILAAVMFLSMRRSTFASATSRAKA